MCSRPLAKSIKKSSLKRWHGERQYKFSLRRWHGERQQNSSLRRWHGERQQSPDTPTGTCRYVRLVYGDDVCFDGLHCACVVYRRDSDHRQSPNTTLVARRPPTKVQTRLAWRPQQSPDTTGIATTNKVKPNYPGSTPTPGRDASLSNMQFRHTASQAILQPRSRWQHIALHGVSDTGTRPAPRSFWLEFGKVEALLPLVTLGFGVVQNRLKVYSS